jgi:hypothetical protein
MLTVAIVFGCFIKIAVISNSLEKFRSKSDLVLLIDTESGSIHYQSPAKCCGPAFSLPFSEVAEMNYEVDSRGEGSTSKLTLLTTNGEVLQVGRNSRWDLEWVSRRVAFVARLRLFHTEISAGGRERKEILFGSILPPARIQFPGRLKVISTHATGDFLPDLPGESPPPGPQRADFPARE